ncbi:hypothetical protein LCGC14_3006070, partial [marine sediment metagenome]
MRVAICISGTLRHFKSCYPSFRKYILNSTRDYTFDVFIQVWKSKISHFKKDIPDEGTFKEATQLYKAVAYEQEIYDNMTRNQLYKETRLKKFQKNVSDWSHHPKRTAGQWSEMVKCPICRQTSLLNNKCRVCGGLNIHNQIGMFYNIKTCN